MANRHSAPPVIRRSPSPKEPRRSQSSTDSRSEVPKRTLSASSNSNKDDSQGLLSTIYSVAHNAANIIGAKHGRSRDSITGRSVISDDSSNTKRPLNIHTGLSIASDNAPYETPTGDASGSEIRLSMSPANVNFEPVHESPLNTMGNGDLSLDHFEQKEPPAAAVTKSTQVPVKGNPFNSENGNRLVVSGNDDTKIVRKKSLSHASFDSNASDHSLMTNSSDNHSFHSGDLSNFDLDQDVDQAKSGTPTKKDKEFHTIFKKIPTSEPLLADFSCALSKDILVQGKLYLTPHFICFNSNILGWVTHLVIPFQEVVQIEKKHTAVLFPNGMVIRTLHQKFVFATFLSRDATFKTITSVWHKALQGKGDSQNKARRKSSRASALAASDPADTGYSTEAEDDGVSSDEDLTGTDSDSLEANGDAAKQSTEKNEQSEDADDAGDSKEPSSPAKNGGSGNIPGPTTHEPTSFEHEKDGNETHLMDHTFKAPLGAILNILYGPDSSQFIGILEKQKVTDITKEKITEIMSVDKEREYSYIKPLGGAIGPKQTKCNITEKVLHFDLNSYCEIEQITQTPDVPSGSSFKVKTRQFFTWDANNSTKVDIFSSVEWTAKSWIKGAVEKGSTEGQKATWKSIVEAVEDILSSGGAGGPKKRRRKTQGSISAPKPAAPVETKAEPETLGKKIASLCESCGQMIPIPIPFLDDTMKGGLFLFIISLLYSLFVMRLSGGSSKGSKLRIGDSSTKMISIDNDSYFIFPTSDTFLRDEIGRKKSEDKLWRWLIERTEGRNVDTALSGPEFTRSGMHHDAEVLEMLKITKDRIDQIYENIG